MRTTTTIAAAMAAAALTLGLTGPAHAAGITVTDPDDTSHGSDLRAVKLNHKDRSVVVVTTHTDLRKNPKSGSGGAVYLDTDPNDKGPEFVFVGGYFEGTDYQLLHTDGFGHRKWGEPVTGAHRMTIDYAKERVRMRMSRKTLGRPAEVRIAVRVSGTRKDGTSDGLVDWLGEPRSFTEWVARG
ncbi:hypothetical protein [Nocardioides sp.]|uniref:hypothetical protein n=1 Tax=Nocardioides sp. TaxID=35761 RepID=UPI002735A1DA|nr:hypothetical protein [Nocardioides sp.]MDP3890042.1 hypothetical protein [Nocardioides sp.]